MAEPLPAAAPKLNTAKQDVTKPVMKINANFDQRVMLHTDEIPWRDSPMPGVSRRPLDRIGDEIAKYVQTFLSQPDFGLFRETLAAASVDTLGWDNTYRRG